MASQRPDSPTARPAGPPSSRARLLLVEDDPSIRRFVAMALEDLAVEVVEAGTLAWARKELAEGEYSLLLTDLMLPDGHGLSLLGSEPAPGARPGPRMIVFSAGISLAVRQQALALGAWRVLDKPVPLATLSACVQEALDETAKPANAAPPASQPTAGDRRDSAIATHFAGQAALFDRFRAASLLQFAVDIINGDTALARGDSAALHRLAHSLKTVLQLLGDDAASALARRLESAAAAGGPPAALATLWHPLRRAVLAHR